MKVDFGWAAPTLMEQLKAQGVEVKGKAATLRRFEKDRKALLRLHLRSLLTDKEFRTACERLAREVHVFLRDGAVGRRRSR